MVVHDYSYSPRVASDPSGYVLKFEPSKVLLEHELVHVLNNTFPEDLARADKANLDELDDRVEFLKNFLRALLPSAEVDEGEGKFSPLKIRDGNLVSDSTQIIEVDAEISKDLQDRIRTAFFRKFPNS
jgi:hypothetical protein